MYEYADPQLVVCRALKRVYQDIMGYEQPMTGVSVPGGDLNAFRAAARKALVSVGLASWSGTAYPSQIASGNVTITVPEKFLSNIPRFGCSFAPAAF